LEYIFLIREGIKMDFGFSGNYHLSRDDKNEILNAISNGMSVEEAVEDWASGLNDLDYFIVNEFILDRIIDYFENEV